MMTASSCNTILGNIFLLNGGSSNRPSAKPECSSMQAFVRLPAEFDNSLLNAAGYFDISPTEGQTQGGTECF